MNKIITNYVSDPVSEQPFTAGSLDFLQNATTEVIAAIVQSLTHSDTVSFFTPYVLYGCKKTSLGGGNYSYTAGYIFFKGEVFSFPAISSIAIPDTDVVTITVTNDSVADPIIFTDNIPRNVHNHRTLVLTDGLSGSGDFNFNSVVYINRPKDQQIAAIADFGYYKNGVNSPHTMATLVTPNDGIWRNYQLEVSVGLGATGADTALGQADCRLHIYSGSTELSFMELQSWTNNDGTGHYTKNVNWSPNLKAFTQLAPNSTITFVIEDVVSNGGIQVVTGYATMFEL